MTYIISLDHSDFVLLMEVRKRAKESGFVTWSPCDMVCINSKVEFNEAEG